MELLIALVVFIVGFMVFGSLIYGGAKIFMNRKFENDESGHQIRNSIHLRVNKKHSAYSFK